MNIYDPPGLRRPEAVSFNPLALALILTVPALLSAPGETGFPEGCTPIPDGYRCEWDLAPEQQSTTHDVPETRFTLLSVRIEAQLPGSYVWLLRAKDHPADNLSTLRDPQGGADAAGSGFATPDSPEEDWSAFVELDEGPHEFHIEMQNPNRLRVVVEAHESRGSRPAGERAGSVVDPQLADGIGDSDGPGFTDIAGAWMDDPVLDDGIIECGMHVPRLAEARVDPSSRLDYELSFVVLGTRYAILWGLANTTVATTGWFASFIAEGESGSAEMFLDPEVDLANGTLRVRLPLRALGDPPEGVPFDAMEATAVYETTPTRFLLGAPVGAASGDSATTMTRPFAVGGPEVWARLRGASVEAVAGPAETGLPLWLPLLAIAAVVTSAGALLVARRRARPPALVPSPGALLAGKYLVERRLGRGAFGEVWLARHLALNRPVVLKRLHPEWSDVETARERFREEARILASLDHANVTKTYDAEPIGEAWYLVLEYVPGGSLDACLAQRRLPPADARRIVEGLLRGVAYVHGRGILHRDLKPANVLLAEDGAAKVADFGVARATASPRLTAGLDSPGTPLYMAPEQVRGAPADARSDLYSAAAIAFEVFTGAYYLDVDVADVVAVQRAVLDAPPRADVELPPALAAWLARGLAKRREERFANAEAMLAALPA